MHIFLIILPLLFQIIFGRKAIGGDIKLSFGSVCLISFLGQIILTISAFKLIVYYLEKNNNACGMPLVGLVMLSLLFSVILFITMLIQDRIRKSYEDDEIDKVEDEDNKIEDNKIEDNKIEDNKIEDDKIEDDKIEDDKIEDNENEEDEYEEDEIK